MMLLFPDSLSEFDLILQALFENGALVSVLLLLSLSVKDVLAALPGLLPDMLTLLTWGSKLLLLPLTIYSILPLKRNNVATNDKD